MATTPPRRLTRAEAKERTRRRLLDAGRRVFLRAGYHAASLEQVAGEAGLTKGAVYSTFASKADLFLAIYDERVAERSARYAQLVPAPSAGELSAAGAREWVRVMHDDRAWSMLLLEFWIHAARDEELRRRFAERRERQRAALARVLETAAELAGARPALSAEDAATCVMALGNGFNLERFSDPASDEGLYLAAHDALRRWLLGAHGPDRGNEEKGAR